MNLVLIESGDLEICGCDDLRACLSGGDKSLEITTSPDLQIFSLFLSHRQSLASFRPAAFENETAVLGAHPHHEPMGAPPAAAIRLKRALHWTP